MATLPASRVPGSLMAPGLQRASPSDSGSRTHEAHLSTEPDSAPSRPWLPLADEDPRWPARAQASPGQGAEAAHSVDSVETRVIPPTGPFPREARIRRSREFREIAEVGRRHSSGAFVLLVRPTGGTGRRAARHHGEPQGRKCRRAQSREAADSRVVSARWPGSAARARRRGDRASFRGHARGLGDVRRAESRSRRGFDERDRTRASRRAHWRAGRARC